MHFFFAHTNLKKLLARSHVRETVTFRNSGDHESVKLLHITSPPGAKVSRGTQEVTMTMHHCCAVCSDKCALGSVTEWCVV